MRKVLQNSQSIPLVMSKVTLVVFATLYTNRSNEIPGQSHLASYLSTIQVECSFQLLSGLLQKESRLLCDLLQKKFRMHGVRFDIFSRTILSRKRIALQVIARIPESMSFHEQKEFVGSLVEKHSWTKGNGKKILERFRKRKGLNPIELDRRLYS